jgi:hypothetical protein
MTPPTVLTDTERNHRPPRIRADFQYWLDFTIRISPHRYRRWFLTVESRNTYIVNLPAETTVVAVGALEDL